MLDKDVTTYDDLVSKWSARLMVGLLGYEGALDATFRSASEEWLAVVTPLLNRTSAGNLPAIDAGTLLQVAPAVRCESRNRKQRVESIELRDALLDLLDKSFEAIGALAHLYEVDP